MRLSSLAWMGLSLLTAIESYAQSSSSSNSSSSARSTITSSLAPSATPNNSSLQLVTTTLTSLITPSPSADPYTTTLVLTLTVNSTSFSNGTVTNTTVENGTLANATEPWKEGDDWIPFQIKIDPAYGVLGAFLIISGIPVAMLGGKMRWSSLAIASGYSIMLFTLVLILRFGVEPTMQPPSPQYPSTTLRGLYLLACIISSFFGAAIGIFFFNFSKYWVSAAGGFVFGWFLLATKDGGLIHTVLGRWGLLGSLTVGAFLCSLVPILHDHMMLISTAWIGATAFVLGVDCYTRAGLKEFYIYNLGYRGLFPKLEGGKYPLTQTMMIELGILAAVVVIGAAIQFKLLNMLTKKIKQQRAEEEARVEAEEVARAAEHFKNVGSDLQEWEEKYGNGGERSPGSGDVGARSSGYDLDNDRASVLLPALHFDEREQRPGRTSSTASLLQRHDRNEPLSLNSHSPTSVDHTPTTAHFTGAEELLASDVGPTATAGLPGDAELESKLKLLEEVKRARESVHSSLERIRAGTPTPSISQGMPSPTPSGAPGYARTPSSVGLSDDVRSRRGSTTSSKVLDAIDKPRVATQSEWDEYVRNRHVISPPPTQFAVLPTSAAMVDRGTSRHSQYALVSDGVAKALDRRERTISMMESQVAEDWGPRETLDSTPAHVSMGRRAMSFHEIPLASPVAASRPQDRSSYSAGPRQVIGSAAGHTQRPGISQSRSAHGRTMTYDELTERHRQRLSALQAPVSAKIREPMDIASAKASWDKQKRVERDEMKRREAEKLAQAHARERRGPAVDKKEVLKSTDEWRRSVHGGLDGFAVPHLPAHARGSTQPGGSGAKRSSLSQRPSNYFAN